jgi:serine/threonine-protein kinase
MGAAQPEEEELSLGAEGRIDEKCVRFEAAWKAGSQPRLEEYLAETADQERAALLRELLRLELHYRSPAPGLDECQRRFPEHTALVREEYLRAFPQQAVERPAELTLTVIAGPHTGQSFPFTGHDTFIVGRSKRAHFRLSPARGKDLRVSRFHFMVEVNPPLCQVLDMNSHNGTWVNGARVTRAGLKDGDVIKAGHSLIRVELASPVEERTAAWSGNLAAGPVPVAVPPLPAPAKGPAVEGIPQPIPGYLLLGELGRGGMGVIYLARREADGSAVALKCIKPAVAAKRKHVERFFREARILQELKHPHIVPFLEMGEAGGQLFFAMEYVPGSNARALLREKGPLPVRSAVRLVNQMLLALAHAHGRGFVHRDVKPDNVLIEEAPGRKVVKLADFGLARAYQASQLSGLTLQNEMGGTMGFMPPEQITDFRSAKPASDQYASAATLYNLLTGHGLYDFPADVAVQLALILHDDPVAIRARRADLGEDLAGVIHRALARDPGDRYPDVEAFRQALLPFAR